MNIGDFFASSLVAALVAFLLTQAASWQRTAKQSRALIRGIQVEIGNAQECAEAYSEDYNRGLWAPAYRIVTQFLGEGIVKLAVNGHLTAIEVTHLHKLYVAATEANRSLDLLEQLNNRTPIPPPSLFGFDQSYVISEQMAREASRARLKFGNVSAAIPEARSAVEAALARLAWFETQS